MKSGWSTSELRIPAEVAYIVVAKRAAAGFAYIAGFGVEAMDELGIAIAQACENAIRCVDTGAGAAGQLRVSFTLEDQRLTVQVASRCARTALTAEQVADGDGGPARVPQPHSAENVGAEPVSSDLALRVMGLFVDDCRYRRDERTGGLRVRLTKYRVS